MKISAFQKRWNEKYDLLVEYKQEHGHCNVPRNDIFNGQKLGFWADKQRRFYKEGKLPEDRIDRLNEIGFDWSPKTTKASNALRAQSMKVDTYQNRWNEKYDLLVEYKQEHGHCSFPTKDIFNGQQLGKWVDTQRRLYKKGKLPGDRVDRLNEIGFNWSVHDVSWEEQFKQLVEFKGKHGHYHVPLKYLDNPSLGSWVNEQRKSYKGKGGKGGKELRKDRIDRLNGIGFMWDPPPPRGQTNNWYQKNNVPTF